MKKLLSFVVPALILAACSSLPQPQTPEQSLVIGYFSMFFPGGYFDSASETIDSNIELDVRDITTGGWILQFLNGGHFWFLGRGGDTYEIVSSRANLENGSRRYIFGPRPLGIRIAPTPGKVLSLGNIRLEYTRNKDTWAVHPEIDYEVRNMGGMGGVTPSVAESMIKTDVAYDVSLSQQFDDNAVRSFMKKLTPSSPWLSRDIVDAKIPSTSAVTQ